MKRTAGITIAFVFVALGCVRMKPLVPVAPDAQAQPTIPSPNTQDAGFASTQILALIGDGFAADILAGTSANGSMDSTTAASLSADFLTWKLTQKPVDNTTKMNRYTQSMNASPAIGSHANSILSQLKASTPTSANSIVRHTMLAGELAKGEVPMAAPAARVVVLQIGTDDFCAGTPVEEFSTQYETALDRVTSAHPNAKIVALPVLNIDAVATAYPPLHTVTGFAGTLPTCAQMRQMLTPCHALSESKRDLGDIAKMNDAIASAVASQEKQQPGRAIFVNWNVDNPTASLDCTHASAETLQRMGESAWPRIRDFLEK